MTVAATVGEPQLLRAAAAVDDLGELVRTRPTGAVSSKLDWTRISEEEFEGLVFELVRTADGYENANWLMRTHAADRGRDIEVHRVVTDPLAETKGRRVIVQCKHSQIKSVDRNDLVACIEAAKLWEGVGLIRSWSPRRGDSRKTQ